MEQQLELKRKKHVKGVAVGFRRFFFILFITLIFALLLIFFVGRTVASVASDELGSSIYEHLRENGYSLLADLFFKDKYYSAEPDLTETVSSRPEGISVLFSNDFSSVKGGGIVTFSPEGYEGKLIAVKNPLRFSVGMSTQQSNTLSALMSLSGASAIFSSRDSEEDHLLVSNGAWVGKGDSESFTYLGFTGEGILSFGRESKASLSESDLKWATEQEIYTLISGGIPQGFDLEDIPLKKRSLSIGQCADGSILILFLEGDSSCKDAMEIFYKYNAVNAAMIYIGEDAAFLTKDESIGSYATEGPAEYAHYHAAWIFR